MDRSIVKLELSVERSKFRNLISPPWACRSFPTLKDFSVKIRGDSNTCDLLMPHMECASLWKLPITQQVSIVHMACGLYYRFCNTRLFEVHGNRMTFSTLEYLKSFFKSFIFICVYVWVPACLCVHHACAVPSEARWGHRNSSYRQLCGAWLCAGNWGWVLSKSSQSSSLLSRLSQPQICSFWI